MPRRDRASATRSALPGRLSTRLQPNHPTDDPAGIAASILDGLMYGAGDAVIGINPATDNLDTVSRACWRMLDEMRQRLRRSRRRSCVLAHVTTTMAAIERGAPVDLVFQSIAGTEAANARFGITLALLARGPRGGAARSQRGTVGDNVMYFETGQGSALSAERAPRRRPADAARRAPMRWPAHFKPLLVNTVVGFIGPEYLYDGKQIMRAGLEDHFCGKLLGLPMGCDICYTNHAEADQDDMDALLTLLAIAGCTFIMGVPGADDVMLELPEHVVSRRALPARSCSGCGRRRNSRRGSPRWASPTQAAACTRARRNASCASLPSLRSVGVVTDRRCRGRPRCRDRRRAGQLCAD